MDKEDWDKIDEMFSEVYLLQDVDKNLVCLKPVPMGDGNSEISLMFTELNGSFYDLGQWSYIKQKGILL